MFSRSLEDYVRKSFLVLLTLGVLAMGEAFAQGLPEGTYASSKEGCTKLKSKTAAELGEDLDFYVLTAKRFIGYQQVCDFLNVTPHNATSWVATAFCEQAGYNYPDLFAIAKNEAGELSVTSLTDLAQQAPPEASSSQVSGSDQGENAGQADGEAPGGGDQNQAEENAGAEQATPYVRCENVKH
jgi:hypothetical protein